jgi:hypothetical protein
MANPLSNNKKVRGGRRQIARVELWTRHFAQLDEDTALGVDGSVHAKLVIDPWFRLVKRTPPFWLRRLMFNGLVRVFDAWRIQLEAKRPRAYLKILLVNPDFIESRVIAGVDEQADFSSTFHPKATPLRPFPLNLLSGASPTLDGFDWTAHSHDEFAEDEDFASPAESEDWRRRAWRQFACPGGGTTYAVRRGDAWIGSWRSA